MRQKSKTKSYWVRPVWRTSKLKHFQCWPTIDRKLIKLCAHAIAATLARAGIDVRSWHFSDVADLADDVGSWGQSGVRRETGKE